MLCFIKKLDDVQNPKQDKQYTYNVTLRCILTTTAVWKTMIITYCECVCSLTYPACNEMSMHHIVTSDLPQSTLFFHIISKKGTLKKNSEYKMFRFPLQLSSATFLILTRTERDTIKNV
jgi:hypothetical protein